MTSPGRRTPSFAKRALLAGAALALTSSAALAQDAAQDAAQKPAAPSPDGLAPGELYMEADQVSRDDKAHRTVAEGHVELRYEGRTLRANRLVYDEGEPGKPGVIRAYGDVQIINSDGSIEFADQITLDQQMSAGVARGFSARMADNAKIAAGSVVRRSEDIQELNRAIYTPCVICTADGQPRTPTWSISADRVVQDRKRHLIFYRNARIRILGAPLFYFPVFWHADPTAGRVSGLLAPRLGASDRRGFSYEQPYLWAATPSMDVVISPQINTKVNPFLNGQIRKRFYSGDIDLRFGYTYEKDIQGNGERFGDATSRSYILGRGSFQLNNEWIWGFTAEQTSDRFLFDKYDIGDVFQSRGPYMADDRRLISQLYAIRQDAKSYFSVAAIETQSLRVDPLNPVELENNRTFPVIAPLVDGHYDPNVDILGGRIRFKTSAVVLTRDQAPQNPALPGIDSRRVTAEADWRRSFTSAGGLRFDPFISVRADAYSLGDVPTGVGVQVESRAEGRALATAGVDVTYPFYRRWRDATVILEPVAQFVVSPDAKQIVIGRQANGDPVYLDEDSAAFEFDESNLFRPNKFPGYDLYDDGARMNVAGRASVLWDDGRRANLLVGRSFRTEEDKVFSQTSGLRSTSSDWIVAADAQPMKGVSFFARARLDSDTLDVHRLEAGANASTRWASGFIRYLDQDPDQTGIAFDPITGLPTTTIAGVRKQNMDIGGELYLTKNWGVTLYGNRDFSANNGDGAWVVRDVGVFYRDDCIRVDVIYRREDVVVGRLRPTNQIALRLTLATLGSAINVR